MKRIVGICMAATLVLCSCGSAEETVKAPELINAVGVDMDTEEVKKMDLSGVTSFTAQVVPGIEGLSFTSSGNIEDLYVTIGDRVKKGELLATLSGASGNAKRLKEEIASMKESNADINKQSQYDIDMQGENLKNLKKQLKQAKKTMEKKSLRAQILETEENIKIAKEKLAQQKEMQTMEIRQKQADLTEAKKNSKGTKLYSTIDGEVISTTGGSGYMVQGGAVAIQVANMKEPRLRTAYVSDSKLAKASSYVAVVDGKKYEIEVEEQELTREEIEMGQYPKNTWFDFVDKNVNIEIGESATVELYTDSVKDALVVPTNAVYQNGEESYVYVVNGDAKNKVVVTTGTETDAYIQIVTGVKEGDVVYVES
nr:efflux RND transporter periplasmic adaptor subunit [Eubacterium sp.]